jgi:hypothetical protein
LTARNVDLVLQIRLRPQPGAPVRSKNALIRLTKRPDLAAEVRGKAIRCRSGVSGCFRNHVWLDRIYRAAFSCSFKPWVLSADLQGLRGILSQD